MMMAMIERLECRCAPASLLISVSAPEFDTGVKVEFEIDLCESGYVSTITTQQAKFANNVATEIIDQVITSEYSGPGVDDMLIEIDVTPTRSQINHTIEDHLTATVIFQDGTAKGEAIAVDEATFTQEIDLPPSPHELCPSMVQQFIQVSDG